MQDSTTTPAEQAHRDAIDALERVTRLMGWAQFVSRQDADELRTAIIAIGRIDRLARSAMRRGAAIELVSAYLEATDDAAIRCWDDERDELELREAILPCGCDSGSCYCDGEGGAA